MTNTTDTQATKLTLNKAQDTVTIKAGRKNIGKVEVPAGLTQAQIEGTLAAIDLATVTEQTIADALAAMLERKGSVIPDDYRHQYGVDQNCGDKIAADLKAKTTDGKGKADMAAVEKVAGQNGLGDKYDQWVSRGLNNGMVRMNLGNMLRAKARKGEEVTI